MMTVTKTSTATRTRTRTVVTSSSSASSGAWNYFPLFFLTVFLSFLYVSSSSSAAAAITTATGSKLNQELLNALRLPSDLEDGNPCPVAAASKPASCPVTCFRTDPVCGVDGVTYWCGCAEAICAGTRVAKLGYCEVGSGGSAPLSGQALLLVHIVWLIVLGFSVLFGLF